MTTRHVTLPSGLEVELRDVSLFALIHTGQIPNSLLPMVRGMAAGSAPDPREIEASLAAEGAIQQYVSFFIHYAKRAMVTPRLVDDDPSEGEISIWDLTDTDYVALFARSQLADKTEEVGELAPFRPERGGDDAGGGDGPPMEPAAV